MNPSKELKTKKIRYPEVADSIDFQKIVRCVLKQHQQKSKMALHMDVQCHIFASVQKQQLRFRGVIPVFWGIFWE